MMKSINPTPCGGSPALSTLARVAVLLLSMTLLLPAGSELQAAIAFRAASNANNGTGAMNLTINKPSGVVSGDVMLAGIARVGASSSITPPTGWTHVRNLNDGFNLEIYQKTAGASEPSSYTWTLSATQRVAGGIAAFSGVDTANPIQVENGAVEGTTAKTAHATPSITTTGTSTWLVSIFADRRESGAFSTWTPPGGTTERADDHSTHATTTNSSVAIYTVGPVSAGSVSHTATASGSSQYAAMEIIALNAATAGSPPAAPSGLSATTISNTQINLAWTDNSSDETGFKIERKTGAGGTYSQIDTTGANVTTYNNTGLTAGTNYYYRVRAYNGNGDSAYSNEANATTTTGSGFACLDGGGGPLDSSHANLGTIDGYAPLRTLTTGGNARYDFTGTIRSTSLANPPGDLTWQGKRNLIEADGNAGTPTLDGFCVSGGAILCSNMDADYNWNTLYQSTNTPRPGIMLREAKIANGYFEGFRAHGNGWDVVGLGSGMREKGSINLTFRKFAITLQRDDAFENDNRIDQVTIEDCFVESFVFYSSRNNGSFNGSSHTNTIQNNLIRSIPCRIDNVGNRTTYVFKMDSKSPMLILKDNVFAISQSTYQTNNDPFYDLTNNGKLHASSSGNIICWLGAGAYPHTPPTGFTVKTGTDAQTHWDNAVATWWTTFPGHRFSFDP